MDPLPYRPLPLPAGVSRRRLEVFSPKLDRRLSLSSYDAWRCWLALEANPDVVAFCERPARVAGRGSALIDFWVQLRGQPKGEFWLLVNDSADPDPSGVALPRHLHGRPVRTVTSEIIASWEIPLANWAQIVPFLVSFRAFRQPLLEQSLVVQLARWMNLAELLDHFADHDCSAVQAALFWLLATGRVHSPELATAPLSAATRFRRR